MTAWTLIRRSLRFHARSHLGALLGAAIGSVVLIGALIVGDSVRGSLRDLALQRLGKISCALQGGDRLFRADLAERIASISDVGRKTTVESTVSPILSLPAIASRTDGTARANRVALLGVETNIVDLGGDPRLAKLPGDSVALNEALADHLNAQVGDTVVFRTRKPSALSLEAPITPQSDSTFVLRLKVHSIIPATRLGNFNLAANQIPPFNAFVPIGVLQKSAHVDKRANLIVGNIAISYASYPYSRFEWLQWIKNKYHELRNSEEDLETFSQPPDTASLNEDFLAEVWRLEDAQITSKPLPDTHQLELRSERIFIDDVISQAALTNTAGLKERRWTMGDEAETNLLLSAELTNAEPILTYFVNQLRSGDHTTPYSMVTAAGPPLVPADLDDNEIIINEWLADDLQVGVGGEVELTFFQPESAGHLVEQTNRFRVRGIVPLTGRYADRGLMPDFPGIAQAERTENWDAGFPLVHTIRPKDEQYWKEHRGTPKAFISLATGQKLWGNRFGNLTAIRFPLLKTVEESNRVERTAEILEKKIQFTVSPEQVGLRFESIRDQALAAANQSEDFGGLFLGFSFFLIVASILLMALMFQFGLEQRSTEIGTLLSLGFTPKKVRRMLLLEGAVVSIIGGILGALGGVFFAKAMLHALTTIWRSAVGTSSLHFHATSTTLLIGFATSFILSTLTVWWILRKQARQPAHELLNEGATNEFPTFKKPKRFWSKWIAIFCGVSAFGLLGFAISQKQSNSAENFFSAGMLLLIAAIATAAWLLRKWSTSTAVGKLSLSGMAMRNSTRRKNRSLATIALLASGSFLVASIGAFKLSSDEKADQRSSGTGGFALIGETAMPLVQNLNTQTGREFFGLNENELAGVSFVPFRVRDGDETSCLNLNRAQNPRLLGVNPVELEKRKTFSFARISSDKRWDALQIQQTPNEVPAIGDEASVTWALHKNIGDTLDYTDERGNPFTVRIVGTVANSILQGSLIIDEQLFREKFPGSGGYRMFLIDAPRPKLAEISKELSRGMQDVGLEMTPTTERLAAFNAVQNTYLNTFQILGSLGLLLGSAGLGVVVLRNVLERRSELALLLAVGFQRRTLRRVILSEHAALLFIGLFFGIISAFFAILPELLSPRGEVPYGSLGLTLGAILLSGLLWTWLATRVALRGELLKALRNE